MLSRSSWMCVASTPAASYTPRAIRPGGNGVVRTDARCVALFEPCEPRTSTWRIDTPTRAGTLMRELSGSSRWAFVLERGGREALQGNSVNTQRRRKDTSHAREHVPNPGGDNRRPYGRLVRIRSPEES